MVEHATRIWKFVQKILTVHFSLVFLPHLGLFKTKKDFAATVTCCVCVGAPVSVSQSLFKFIPENFDSRFVKLCIRASQPSVEIFIQLRRCETIYTQETDVCTTGLYNDPKS